MKITINKFEVVTSAQTNRNANIQLAINVTLDPSGKDELIVGSFVCKNPTATPMLEDHFKRLEALNAFADLGKPRCPTGNPKKSASLKNKKLTSAPL